MKTDISFNLRRFFLLLKRMLYMQRKSFLFSMIGYLGMLAIISIICILEKSYKPDAVIFSSAIFMFVFGFISSSKIFSDIHKPSRAINYLTLPASHFEKFMVGWIMTSFIYVIMFTLLTYISVAIGNVLSHLIMNESYPVFGTFAFGKAIKYYILIQTVFLCGGAYFKSNQFFKTIVVVSLFKLAIFLLTILAVIFIYGELGTQNEVDFINSFLPTVKSLYLYKIVIFYIMPLVFLIVTYFRIKEKEI